MNSNMLLLWHVMVTIKPTKLVVYDGTCAQKLLALNKVKPVKQFLWSSISANSTTNRS